MTDEEIRAHAKRLIGYHNDEYEFGLVYEDDALWDLSEQVQQKIYEAMCEATVTVTFD